ncbi:MAG: Fe-S protein assembly co-chaperone HscB [Alphaproteobacteria bacterium]|nr:Fe-S protein assembly co-chaperone HscB [Alphaproteobacteria bacterium]
MKKEDADVENLSMFDPFAILNINKTFSIDLMMVEKCYFEAQKQIHPDRFINASSDIKKDAVQRSSEVNKAYHILKDPLLRATFLLENEDIKLLSNEPLFLAEVMAWNERQGAGEDLSEELKCEKELLVKELAASFECKDYERARTALYKLTYVQKVMKQ